MDCDQLNIEPNLIIVLSDGYFDGSVATFSCSPGYDISASYSLLCSDQAWNGIPPSCTIKDCREPQDGQFSSVSTPSGTLFGSTATYSCNINYSRKIGNELRYCTEDGLWSGAVLDCIYDCGELEDPEFCNVELSSTVKEATAIYSSLPGYLLVGNAQRICEENQGWSGTAPSCTPVDCGNPGFTVNTQVSTPDGTYFQSVATYICNTNYIYLSGSLRRQCSEDGNWSGIQPSCIYQCASPPSVSNGSFTVDTNLAGGRATYSCNSGYTLFGSGFSECSDGTGWTLTTNVCRKDCPVPGSGYKSEVADTPRVYDSEAVYTCNVGYVISSGSASRRCTETGQWDGSPLVCIYQCGSPPRIDQGSFIVDKTVTGARASYTCNIGYTLFGSLSIVCIDGQGWEVTHPICRQDCPAPEGGQNAGVLHLSVRYDSVATYTCQEGYVISSGNVSRRCSDDGQWDGSALICIYQCGNPQNIDHGRITFNSTITGSQATYACVEGYTLSGPRTTVCVAGVGWVGILPICRPDCPVPESGQNADVSHLSVVFDSVATYTCHEGYVTSSGSASRRCSAEGLWDGSALICIFQCDTPHNIDHGIITVDTTVTGGRATYACIEGHTLSGPGTRVCVDGIGWDGIQPICRQDCPVPESGPNSQVTFLRTVYDSEVTYMCTEGYIVDSGNVSRRCSEDGQWSGFALVCIFQCGDPPVEEHGTFTVNSTVADGLATYSCNDGFTLFGSDSRKCIPVVGWNETDTRCLKDCGSPPTGQNATVSTPNRKSFGSTAVYTCITNYTDYYGNNMVYCAENGTWNGTSLTCVYDCGVPTSVERGNTSFAGTVTGERVHYTCPGGYSLSGNDFRVCVEDVGWNGTRPTCLKDCDPPEDGQFSTVSTRSLNQGSLAEYICRQNYTRVGGDMQRVCVEDGQWNGSVPTCSLVDCGRPASEPNVRISVNTTTVSSHANHTCDEGYDMPVGPIVKVCNSNGSWAGDSILCKPKTARLY